MAENRYKTDANQTSHENAVAELALKILRQGSPTATMLEAWAEAEEQLSALPPEVKPTRKETAVENAVMLLRTALEDLSESYNSSAITPQMLRENAIFRIKQALQFLTDLSPTQSY